MIRFPNLDLTLRYDANLTHNLDMLENTPSVDFSTEIFTQSTLHHMDNAELGH